MLFSVLPIISSSMDRHTPDSCYSPWADWTARQIPNPLLRLRFLQTVAPAPQPSQPRKPRNSLVSRRKIALLAAACSLLAVAARPSRQIQRTHAAGTAPVGPIAATTVPADPPASPWLVEKTAEFELYSNGLRIEDRYATGNRPRSYLAFPREAGLAGEHRTAPAGIVFHTTESQQAPFEPSQNTVLKRVGESLAEYVRRRQAYNFLIDRFGRVFRIVRETDAANHAGHSIWADRQWIYVNLNDSFLGVSFEAVTGDGPMANPAQIRAAAMLTEVLRSRYRIDPANCVTHAQVSVNPANYQIGYHTDWASSFPFERLGLPDNYDRPLPSLALFGFEYDSAFVAHVGPRLAGAARRSLAIDRKPLRQRYLQLAAAVKHTPAPAAE
jgi:hypothetical protein